MPLTKADFTRKAALARTLYQRDRGLFDRYRGGMPLGYMAVAEAVESGGQMGAPGDADLGEVGVFQVSAHTETEYGVPAGYRTTKLGNYYLAGLDYNVEAARLALRYPHLIGVATIEQWLFSRLVFAIGRPGTYRLLALAQLPAGGQSYDRLNAWVQRALAAGKLPKLGSQSPAKVAYRVNAVRDMWTIGAMSGLDMTLGTPVLPPLPPNLKSMTVPKDVRGLMYQQQGGEHPDPPLRAEDLRPWRPEARGGAVAALAVALVGAGLGLAHLARRL